MEVSPETIQLLLNLLDQVTIPGSAPNLVEQAEAVQRARAELIALVAEDPAP